MGRVDDEVTEVAAQQLALLDSRELGATEPVLEPPALVAPAVVADEGQNLEGAVVDGGMDHRLQLGALQGDGCGCAGTGAAEKGVLVEGLAGRVVQAA